MPTDLPPCADCGHRDPHPAALGCLHAEFPDDECPCAMYVPPTPVVVSSPTLRDARRVGGPRSGRTADLDRARADRDAALAQVEAAASPEWIAAAERAVRYIAGLRSAPFTTDDLWDYLEGGNVPAPREPRAMGPVVKRALARGVIVPAGYTQSRRRHAALIRTYTGAQA